MTDPRPVEFDVDDDGNATFHIGDLAAGESASFVVETDPESGEILRILNVSPDDADWIPE